MKFIDSRFDNITISTLKKDISAGVTVGIVAVPLAMAFAIASGLAPVIGLYTAVIAGILVSMFGGSRFQISGPTGAFIPVVAAVLFKYGYEGLLITTFMSGIIMLLLSVFKVGRIIKFMPISVTVGFTAGIAVVIFTDQIDEFLGITYKKMPHFHENMLELAKNLTNINIYAVLTAILGFFTIFLVVKFKIKIPVLLTALVVPTIISIIFYPTEVSTIGSTFGEIPNKLPEFNMIDISFEKIKYYLPPAFTIAFLGILESLLSASVADTMTNTKMNPDKELFGQGLANTIAPLFGGMPSTGAIARTATNIQSGAVTPISGIIHAIVVLLCILLLSPLASYVPLAAMSPILMRVAYNMSERHHVWKILKTKTGESLVLLLTLLLTVFVDLTVAVEVGVILAILLFIRQMAIQTETIEETERTKGCPQVTVLTFKGPLFFGATTLLDNVLQHKFKEETKIIVFNLHLLPVIDITASELLHQSIKKLQLLGYYVYLSHIPPRVYVTLQQEGILNTVGENRIFYTTSEAIKTAKERLEIL